MKTEWDKMIQGELYDPRVAELDQARRKARDLLKAFNDSRPQELKRRRQLLGELFAAQPVRLWIEPPFYCDYGRNIRLGEGIFFNFNCVILDPAPVDIGDRVLLGPNVQIYTASHPMDAALRSAGQEFALPVRIGEDVWIGGAAVICPGVSIGARSVIGAGSVVTRDIPPDVFAAGNPCRVIRSIEPGERPAHLAQRTETDSGAL